MRNIFILIFLLFSFPANAAIQEIDWLVVFDDDQNNEEITVRLDGSWEYHGQDSRKKAETLAEAKKGASEMPMIGGPALPPEKAGKLSSKELKELRRLLYSKNRKALPKCETYNAPAMVIIESPVTSYNATERNPNHAYYCCQTSQCEGELKNIRDKLYEIISSAKN